MPSPETCLTAGPVLALNPLPGWPLSSTLLPELNQHLLQFPPFWLSPLHRTWTLARLLHPELYEWGDRLYPTLYPRPFPFCLDSLTPGGPPAQCRHYSVHHVEMT